MILQIPGRVLTEESGTLSLACFLLLLLFAVRTVISMKLNFMSRVGRQKQIGQFCRRVNVVRHVCMCLCFVPSSRGHAH
jgi:hypothetical protein